MIVTATSITNEHFIFRQQNIINQLCKDLFKHTDINYFTHERYYKNGMFFNLSNLPLEPVNRVIEFGFHGQNLPKLNDLLLNSQRYLILSQALKLSGVLNHKKFEEGLKVSSPFSTHRLIIAETTENEKYYDGFGFSVYSQSADALPNLIGSIDLLEKFLLYYKSKAHSLIKEAERNCVYLPDFLETEVVPSELKSLYTNRKALKDKLTKALDHSIVEIKEHGVKTYKRKQVLYAADGTMVHLTPREAACLQYLSKGLSAKQIAQQLNISPRTVETHILNMKSKANYQRNIQLISGLKTIDPDLT